MLRFSPDASLIWQSTINYCVIKANVIAQKILKQKNSSDIVFQFCQKKDSNSTTSEIQNIPQELLQIFMR